ncbi:MAG TPA: hypothetical protein VI248_17155 [Kineosporiaceae bacterium]
MKLPWRSLPFALVATLLALVPVLEPARAVETTCLADSASEGFDGVLLHGVTRAEVTQQAANTWDDWIWRGEPYVCPSNVSRCEYSYGKSKTTSTNVSIGGLAQFGNRNSPSKSYLNAFLFLIPNYTKVTEYTTDFSTQINFKPGDTVYPIQVATRRWRRGVYRGGYFKLAGAGACFADGGGGGHWYVKVKDRPWGSWSDNYVVREWATYVVNGHAGDPIIAD